MGVTNSQGPAIQFCTEFELGVSTGPVKISAAGDKGDITLNGNEIDLHSSGSSIGLGKNVEIALHNPVDNKGVILLSATGCPGVGGDAVPKVADILLGPDGASLRVGNNNGVATLVVKPDEIHLFVGSGVSMKASQIILGSDSIVLKADKITLDSKGASLVVGNEGVIAEVGGDKCSFRMSADEIQQKVGQSQVMIQNDIFGANAQKIALACQDSKIKMDSSKVNILAPGVSVKADAFVSIESVKMEMKVEAIAQNKSTVVLIN